MLGGDMAEPGGRRKRSGECAGSAGRREPVVVRREGLLRRELGVMGERPGTMNAAGVRGVAGAGAAGKGAGPPDAVSAEAGASAGADAGTEAVVGAGVEAGAWMVAM